MLEISWCFSSFSYVVNMLSGCTQSEGFWAYKNLWLVQLFSSLFLQDWSKLCFNDFVKSPSYILFNVDYLSISPEPRWSAFIGVKLSWIKLKELDKADCSFNMLNLLNSAILVNLMIGLVSLETLSGFIRNPAMQKFGLHGEVGVLYLCKLFPYGIF